MTTNSINEKTGILLLVEDEVHSNAGIAQIIGRKVIIDT